MRDEELLVALEGYLAGKTQRQIAIDLVGVKRVGADWYSDGGLRALVRRRIAKAVALMEGGYLTLAAGK